MKVEKCDDDGLAHSWWVNIVNMAFDRTGLPDDGCHDATTVLGIIDDCLKQYRAKFNDNNHYIEFETEEDYTMFLLRWS